MSNKRRKKEDKRQRKQAKERKRPPAPRHSTSNTTLQKVTLDIHSEVRHITEMAQAGESRLVLLRDFVLFSTETGDAWLLDAEDDLALCLLQGGEVQPYHIVDTPETFSIEWNATFEIHDEMFLVTERGGRVRSILGYPTEQIANACAGRMP